jgi:hypothetical protein
MLDDGQKRSHSGDAHALKDSPLAGAHHVHSEIVSKRKMVQKGVDKHRRQARCTRIWDGDPPEKACVGPLARPEGVMTARIADGRWRKRGMGEPDCRESGVGAQLVVTLCRDGRAGRREEVRPTASLLSPRMGRLCRHGHASTTRSGFATLSGGETGDELQSGTEGMKRKRNERSGGIGRRRQAELFGWIFDRAGSLRVLVSELAALGGARHSAGIVPDATVMACLAA